jgi:hypothetical protein
MTSFGNAIKYLKGMQNSSRKLKKENTFHLSLNLIPKADKENYLPMSLMNKPANVFKYSKPNPKLYKKGNIQ